jgi:hypothetical protein
MSNQVYNNDETPTPNVYVSQLIGRSPSGGIVTRSLTLTDAPAISVHNERALVRNSSGPDPIGLVELGGAVIIDKLILDANPALNADAVPPRCLVRNATTHAVENAGDISVDHVKLAVAPTLNNGLAALLARNPITGVVEQRLASTLPDSGFTYRVVNVAQLTGDGTAEPVRFPVSGFDDPAGLSYNNATAEFTVLQTGFFIISWTVAWETAPTGTRETWLTVDNVSGVRRFGSIITRPDAPDASTISSCVAFRMTTGSVFRIWMEQTLNVGLDIIGTADGDEWITQVDICRLAVT